MANASSIKLNICFHRPVNTGVKGCKYNTESPKQDGKRYKTKYFAHLGILFFYGCGSVQGQDKPYPEDRVDSTYSSVDRLLTGTR